MGESILKFNFLPTDAFKKGKKFSIMESEVAEITSEAGRAMAEKSRSKVSSWLKKSHKYNVGATDTASENFEVLQTEKRAKSGTFVWSVVEGSKTAANWFIRHGMKKGTVVSIKALRLWAANKGITFQSREEKYGPLRFIKSHSKAGREYARSKNRAKEANTGLWKVRYLLKKEGTKREGSGWYDLQPKGQGRFDYVVKLIREYSDREYQDILDTTSLNIENAIIDWLAGGQKSGGSRTIKRWS